VFGYTAGNDFSPRDLQLRTSQWMTGQTPDQFAPIGPWLVPADQIGDPQTSDLFAASGCHPEPVEGGRYMRAAMDCGTIFA
jgi:hypothetical protein